MQTLKRAHLLIAVTGVVFVASLTGVSTAPQDKGAPPSPSLGPGKAAPTTVSAAAQIATLKQYCVTCHNDRAKTGGVSFEGMTTESVGQHADVFEKAVRKLRGRVMPPPGSRQPDAAAVDSLVSWLET